MNFFFILSFKQNNPISQSSFTILIFNFNQHYGWSLLIMTKQKYLKNNTQTNNLIIRMSVISIRREGNGQIDVLFSIVDHNIRKSQINYIYYMHYFDKFNQEEFLLNKSKFAQEGYSCLICHQILKYPVHCKTCFSQYCKQCAHQWKKQKNTCPLRCTSPWNIQQSQEKNIELKCPINQKCSPMNPQMFELHLKQCHHEKLRKKYLCMKQHELTFLKYSIDIVICSDCGKNNMSRSICITCKEKGQTFLYFYCHKCRIPPFTKQQCPLKHQFIHMIPKNGFMCNVCGNTSSKKQRCYKDKVCGFDICQICYQKHDKLNQSNAGYI